jgi:predicted PurR-regulated permease PerM
MTTETYKPADDLAPDFPTRVALIERSILVLLVIALAIGVLAIVKPFTTAILFGGAIAVAAWPLRQVLVRRGLRRTTVAAFLFLLSIVLILLPILVVAPHLAHQFSQATQRFEAFFAARPGRPTWVQAVPLIGRRLAAGWDKIVAAQGNLQTLLEPYTEDLEQWLIGAARAMADSLVQIILSLIAATMFWANGDGLVSLLHDALRRLGGPVAERALDVAAGAVRGVAYGVFGTAALQAVVLTLGLTAAGIPGAAMLGFIALLLAISQIGAPLLVVIWGGAAWWLFRHGSDGWGTFMIVWGLLVSTVDNVIRPWLIGFGVDMPLSLTIVGVFGGFVAFGFLGLFVGPTLIAIVYTLLMAWRTAVAAHPATADMGSPTTSEPAQS